MTLPILILLALVVPITIVAVVLFFSRTAIWIGLHPRSRGLFFGALAVVYIGLAAWDAVLTGWKLGLDSLIQVAMAVFVLFLAIAEFRRGEVVDLR